MFGVRSEADAELTKKTLPMLRELYRRERSRVPVQMKLEIEEGGEKLTVTDADGNKAFAYGDAESQPYVRETTESLNRSLTKTGGTPFTAEKITVEMDGGPWFIPGSGVNKLHREAQDALLKKREVLRPWPTTEEHVAALPQRTLPPRRTLRARFARWEQVPEQALSVVEYLILPIAQADRVPREWREKTLLELPRVMFGKLEQKTAARLDALQDAGVAGAVVNNPAQLRYTDGWTLYGGLGLNVTNPMSAARYKSLGIEGMLLQPEPALTAMQAVAPGVPTAALCYGHLPLMLTRACPLRHVRDCGKCQGGGTLRDRKGRDFTVTCSAPGGAGVRTVYNPVPRYMGERLSEMPVDVAVAAFTIETPARVSRSLALLLDARPVDNEFTRWLYYTNN